MSIMPSGYWFRDDPIQHFARPISAVFECGDEDILASAIEILS